MFLQKGNERLSHGASQGSPRHGNLAHHLQSLVHALNGAHNLLQLSRIDARLRWQRLLQPVPLLTYFVDHESTTKSQRVGKRRTKPGALLTGGDTIYREGGMQMRSLAPGTPFRKRMREDSPAGAQLAARSVWVQVFLSR